MSDKKFVDPELEILKLGVTDVITTSTGEEDDWWLPEV